MRPARAASPGARFAGAGARGYDWRVPRYLRWIASITTGIIVQILFQIVFLAAVVGTGNKELTGFAAAIATFGAGMVNVITALAINEWLSSRYPIEKKPLVPRA